MLINCGINGIGLQQYIVILVFMFLQKDVEMDSPQTREAVEGMCMVFHQSVRGLAADFQRELQRHYYATPTSYLELISTYKSLLGAKQKQVSLLKGR